MDHPCKPDCPNRSATCRIDCTPWKEYEKNRNQKYKDKLAENERISATIRKIGKR